MSKNQKAVDKLLAECHVIWAFSKEQFLEQKVEEHVPYVSFGGGGYVPKMYKDTFLKQFDKIMRG